MPYYSTMLGRLLLAALLGAIVGMQRERKGRPAGLRTHMLVCIGSALISIVSATYEADPARISAQIVSGIGFLGAGTIIREGRSVRGLTTAASLWAVAGLGIACGHGGQVLVLAVAVTIIIVLTLSLGKALEDRLFMADERNILSFRAEPDALPRVLQALVDAGAGIESAGEHHDRRPHHFALRLRLGGALTRSDAVRVVLEVKGVREAAWGGNPEADRNGS